MSFSELVRDHDAVNTRRYRRPQPCTYLQVRLVFLGHHRSRCLRSSGTLGSSGLSVLGHVGFQILVFLRRVPPPTRKLHRPCSPSMRLEGDQFREMPALVCLPGSTNVRFLPRPRHGQRECTSSLLCSIQSRHSDQTNLTGLGSACAECGGGGRNRTGVTDLEPGRSSPCLRCGRPCHPSPRTYHRLAWQWCSTWVRESGRDIARGWHRPPLRR